MSHLNRNGLKKWFGDLEVIEATHSIRIQPNESDIENAVRNDPMNCIFSKACQRMWSSKAVVFFGTVAYVDLLDKNGIRHVERFSISAEGKRFIKAYDQKKKIMLKSFLLLPPAQTLTSKAVAKKSRKDRQAKREAILLGKTTGAKRPQRKPTGMRLSTFFRNGNGMVQFPHKVD